MLYIQITIIYLLFTLKLINAQYVSMVLYIYTLNHNNLIARIKDINIERYTCGHFHCLLVILRFTGPTLLRVNSAISHPSNNFSWVSTGLCRRAFISFHLFTPSILYY